MKRFYTLLILLVGVFSTLFAHDAEVNGIYYNLDTTNKTAEVTAHGSGYYSGSVNIPASITYNGVSYKVLSIGSGAFSECVSMTSIKIAEGIQEIGEAFYACNSLTSIEFPNSVTTIAAGAFGNFLSTRPGSQSSNIKLRSITFGSGLTKVGERAFYNALDTDAEVHYKGTADKWAQINFGDKDANPLNKAKNLYINGVLLTEANITSATTISAYAFINCTSLTSVKLGSSVQKINLKAFNGCNNLKKITCYATTVPTVANSESFSNYNAYLYVPCASKEDYDLHNIFGSFKYIECITDAEGGNNGGNNTDPTPTPTPSGDVTLYYVNSTAWAAVKAYIWPTGGEGVVAWPGASATKTGKTVDGYDVYAYTFDASKASNIIFNNGNGGTGNQTADLVVDASKSYYYNGVWYASLAFDQTGNEGGGDTPVVPEPEPDPAVPAFVVAGNGGSDATGVWCNGIEWNSSAEANRMKDADKDGIYEITFNQVPAGTWNFKVVVNTESQQWLGGDFLDAENSSAGITVQNGGNIAFTLTKSANVTIKVDAANGKITLTTPSGSFGKVTIDYFTVANTDECLVENRFTAANGNKLTFTETVQVDGNGIGDIFYRILGNCNYAVFEKNVGVEVTSSGTYEVTIKFNGNYDNPVFTVSAVKQGWTPLAVDEVEALNVYAQYGTVYADTDFEIFSLSGVNVTALNGSLQGIYLVKTSAGNRLLNVW